MSGPRCPRVWEAEAVMDRRLEGDTRVAFERHAATCHDCRREVAALERLSLLARNSAVAALSPLERRRQRIALLRRANDDLLSPPRAVPRRPILLVAAIVVIAFAAFARPPRPASAGGWDRGALAGGADVLRLAAAQWADSPDRPPAIVIAEVPAPTATANVPPTLAPPRLSRPPAATSEGASKSAMPPATTVDVGAMFVAAMDAFHDGKYGAAETLFVSFLEQAKGDARCEDASFLRAVARARGGDRGGARSLMKAYLDAYPDGLRRSEAERFANSLAQ